jgi:hypothetical protein
MSKSKKKKASESIEEMLSGSEEFDEYKANEKITKKEQVKKKIIAQKAEASRKAVTGKRSKVEESSESESGSGSESESESESSDKKKTKGKKLNTQENKLILKKAIESWLKCDDRIRDLNNLVKEQKDAKKEREKLILKMIEKMGMEQQRLDVTDKNGNVRARVYRHKSVTKSSIKEDLLKDALMEIYQNEKKADQVIKKVDSKRQLNERFYLKRTKGEGNKKIDG